MDTKDFADKYVRAEDNAFQKGDFTALSKLKDPNIVYHMGLLGDTVGHEAHKQDILGTRQACSGIKQEWKYLEGEGNLYVMDYKSFARITGEKPGIPVPIGKKLSTACLFLIRVANGMIKEAWAGGNRNFLD